LHAVSPLEDPRLTLSRRLRALREEHWPGLGITQQQLGEALGGRKPLSISSISSYESPVNPAVPPMLRLNRYATFFATQRSCESEPYRLLPVSQLTETERAVREELLRELSDLRAAAMQQERVDRQTSVDSGDGLWHFPDMNDITIVSARLPTHLRERFSPFADPESPDYVALYTYADLDALVELYGHIRALNPGNQVNFKRDADLVVDDYTTHLVLLGGVDWNYITKDILDRTDLPVRQVARHAESEIGGFEVEDNGRTKLVAPKLNKAGQLVEDVAHFYRGPNPFNAKRTVSVCNGMFGRGTYGAVRALTDVKFRDRNEGHVRQNMNPYAFSIVSRVFVVQGRVLTPDWTQPETRLHEWTEDIE
jgi:hypothetical protein